MTEQLHKAIHESEYWDATPIGNTTLSSPGYTGTDASLSVNEYGKKYSTVAVAIANDGTAGVPNRVVLFEAYFSGMHGNERSATLLHEGLHLVLGSGSDDRYLAVRLGLAASSAITHQQAQDLINNTLKSCYY